MKVAALIARLLLGLIFLVFGSNGFLNFLKMPMPGGAAGQFAGVIYLTHYIQVVWVLQIVCALLLLTGQFVPLALTILGAIIVNIVLFHSLMAPSGLPLASVIVILWLISAWSVRSAFAGIFRQKVVD
jgi:putative oxidoreductase